MSNSLNREEVVYRKNAETGLYEIVDNVLKPDVAVLDPNISPNGKPVLPQWAVISLMVLSGLAPIVAFIPGAPLGLILVAAAISSVSATLGIASPGLRTKINPVSLTE